MSKRTVVMIESPYKGHGTEAVRYLACCILDSLDRGEAPIATHALYPLALDGSESSRSVAKQCHGALCELYQMHGTDDMTSTCFQTPRFFYADLGVSSGMKRNGTQRIERRTLHGRARTIWERGEWPSHARWSSTNESDFNNG